MSPVLIPRDGTLESGGNDAARDVASRVIDEAYAYASGPVLFKPTMAMSRCGWDRCRMTDRDGQVTTVDKSWGYSKDADGVLRIVLHHSSLPYQP